METQGMEHNTRKIANALSFVKLDILMWIQLLFESSEK